MKTQKPILHARDHMPGGADPIPGLQPGPGSYEGHVKSLTSLQAWYRLGAGDDMTGARRAYDTAGVHIPPYDIAFSLPPPNPPTHIVHPELGGDDDQATQFNTAQTTAGATPWSFLNGDSYMVNTSAAGWTICGFVKPLAVPGVAPGFEPLLFGPWDEIGVGNIGGAGLFYRPSTYQLLARWRNGTMEVVLTPAGVGLLPNTWYHLALVWDRLAGTLSLYVNGNLVAQSTSATFEAAQHALFISTRNTASPSQFYGAVDEVALFSTPLTAAEIASFAAFLDTPEVTSAAYNAKGDLLVGTGPNSYDNLPAGADGQVLTADATQTTKVKWATPRGGIATDTIWDAKGDLAVASGADAAAKLPLGANGQVLTADSAQALGVKWATPAARGAGGLTKLFDATLGADAASIDTGAAGIASGYAVLEVFVYLRTVLAASPTDLAWIRFNNDTSGASYATVYTRTSGTTVNGSNASTSGLEIIAAGATAPAGDFTAIRMVIPNYDNTTGWKSVNYTDGFLHDTGGYAYVYNRFGYWKSTAAISRLSVLSQTAATSIKAGSRLTIFGLN
jgi:hypothetical protein